MTALIAVHLWQSTLILVAAWALTLLCRRNGADLRFLIWFGASVKFLVPLAALQWLGDRLGQGLPQPLAVDRMLIDTVNAVIAPSLPSALQLPDHVRSQVQTIAAAVWVCGTLLLCLRWFAQWYVIRSILAASRPLPMDLPAPVYVTCSSLAPGVFGIFRPVVILPASVVRELSPRQLEAILAHEICHLRRCDNLLAAIHQGVEALFWFHPLVWWLGSNLLREREAACDEFVVEQGHEPQDYAESILNVCRLSVAARFAGVAASTGGDLVQRVSAIMRAGRVQPMDNARFALLLAAVTLVCFAPILTGMAGGAWRAASDQGPVRFDAVTLQRAEPHWRSSAHFDPAAGQLALKNVSLRRLIASAYPQAIVTGYPGIIDDVRYDIRARWHDQSNINERATYRELLRTVLRTDTRLQLYVDRRCEMGCR